VRITIASHQRPSDPQRLVRQRIIGRRRSCGIIKQVDGAYHASIMSHPIMSSELVPAPRRPSVPQLTSQNGHGHRKQPSAIELPNMSHRHHSQLPHNYPGPAYPPSNYHPTARHVSNGPPPPGMMAAPQTMPMSGPPEPMPHMSNGHGHSHAPHVPQMSAAARIGKENMEKTLAQLANANENTWMLIGKRLIHPSLPLLTQQVL
jgi:hypothetical protein